MVIDYPIVFKDGRFIYEEKNSHEIQIGEIDFNQWIRYLGARLSNSSKNRIQGLALLALK